MRRKTVGDIAEEFVCYTVGCASVPGRWWHWPYAICSAVHRYRNRNTVSL